MAVEAADKDGASVEAGRVAVPIRPELEPEFRRLADRWRQETAQVSDVHEIVLHPSYLRIIGLGPDAIPLVLNELRQRPGFWFTALEALTGIDPVPPETIGTKAIREAWLAWGARNGYL